MNSSSFGVPVALGGPTARSKRHEIDAQLRKLERIAERALLATSQWCAERRGINAAHSRRHAHWIEPTLALLVRLLHRQAGSADARAARSRRPASIWPMASSTASNTRRLEALRALYSLS